VSARSGGQSRPGPGGRAKSGKPRPGTGGYGRRRLEGKGPTPPAHLRPGHPAQRRAAARDAGADGQRNFDRRDEAAASRGIPASSGKTDRRAGSGAGRKVPPSPGMPDRREGTGAGAARRYGAKFSSSPGAAEVVAGRNPVLEALRAAVPAVALHIGPGLDVDDRVSEAIKLAADTRVPVVEAGRAELDRLADGAVHQGLALRVRPYSYAHPGDLVDRARAAGQQPLIVALDGVTDPRNLGAVVRSVAAFGGHGVLVPVRRAAGVTAGAWKASAGALARVPVARAANLASALSSYAAAGLFVVGLDPAGGEVLSEIGLADGPLVLVVGAEGRGLSRLAAQRCDALCRIPVAAGAGSLNASVAAGIALYEIASIRARGPVG
jgi:23S rRNA (guanosine2251-2'-O)-methyltransferase